MSLTAPSNCVRRCASQRRLQGRRRPCTALQEGALDDIGLFLEKCVCPFRDPIPEGNGLHVPEVPDSAEVPRHDGLKTFSPSWTKVV